MREQPEVAQTLKFSDDDSTDVRGLDLSKSLIHSWVDIAAIAQELPYLQRLYLK